MRGGLIRRMFAEIFSDLIKEGVSCHSWSEGEVSRRFMTKCEANATEVVLGVGHKIDGREIYPELNRSLSAEDFAAELVEFVQDFLTIVRSMSQIMTYGEDSVDVSHNIKLKREWYPWFFRTIRDIVVEQKVQDQFVPQDKAVGQ